MPKGGRAIDQSTMPVSSSVASQVYQSSGTVVTTIPVGFDGKPVPMPSR